MRGVPEIDIYRLKKNPDMEDASFSNIVNTKSFRNGSLDVYICRSVDKKGEDGKPFCFECVANLDCKRGKVVMGQHLKS